MTIMHNWQWQSCIFGNDNLAYFAMTILHIFQWQSCIFGNNESEVLQEAGGGRFAQETVLPAAGPLQPYRGPLLRLSGGARQGQRCSYFEWILLEAKLLYCPACPSVGWSVCHNFLKERKLTLSCSCSARMLSVKDCRDWFSVFRSRWRNILRVTLVSQWVSQSVVQFGSQWVSEWVR